MTSNPNAAPFVPGGSSFAPSGSRRVRARSGGAGPRHQKRALGAAYIRAAAAAAAAALTRCERRSGNLNAGVAEFVPGGAGGGGGGGWCGACPAA